MRCKKEGLRAQGKRKVELKETVHSVEARGRKTSCPRPPCLQKLPRSLHPRGAPGTMNIFRILGDVSHLLAIIILLLKIVKSKSCAGECSHAPGKEGGPSRRAARRVQAKWELQKPLIAHTNAGEIILLLCRERAVLEGCDVAKSTASGRCWSQGGEKERAARLEGDGK